MISKDNHVKFAQVRALCDLSSVKKQNDVRFACEFFHSMYSKTIIIIIVIIIIIMLLENSTSASSEKKQNDTHCDVTMTTL